MENSFSCIIESSIAEDGLVIPKRGQCKINSLGDFVEIVFLIKEDTLLYDLAIREKIVKRKVLY